MVSNTDIEAQGTLSGIVKITCQMTELKNPF